MMEKNEALVTLQDCIEMYEDGFCAVINDGKLIRFESMAEDKEEE